MKRQTIRVASQRRQFVAQPVLHRQQQFNATSACADHRNRGFAGVFLYPIKQCQPPIIKALNRLHRDRKIRCARHLCELRRGADIDRQLIVRHRRAVAAQHFVVDAVKPDHLIAIQPRTGKHGQPRQIYMHRVIVVMPRHIPRQHTGIGRVHVGTNQRQTHARNGLHAKAFEHADMAVATAN